MVPEDLRYTKEHEWIRVEGDVATIGITDHAQTALGDVVFVDLPEANSEFKKGESFGAVESVKAASDCYMPMSGKIVESNSGLDEAPQDLNGDPYGKGWMVKVSVADAAELDALLSAADYEAFLKEQE